MSTASLRKPILGVALATALLLLIPAVAMQFTSEVSWGPGDFVLAAVLLFGAGALAVFGLAHVKGAGRRAALIVCIAFGLALVWAELAVGLFS
jgi:peptidoglycan/LPS O-acetylase OafA/YrhL